MTSIVTTPTEPPLQAGDKVRFRTDTAPFPSSHPEIEVRCSEEDGVPTVHYEVRAKLGTDGKPTGFYRKAQCSGGLTTLPLTFCDHLHPDVASALACGYFDRSEGVSLPSWAVY